MIDILSRISQVNSDKRLNFDNIELIETTQASLDCSDLENPMGERSKDALMLDFG